MFLFCFDVCYSMKQNGARIWIQFGIIVDDNLQYNIECFYPYKIYCVLGIYKKNYKTQRQGVCCFVINKPWLSLTTDWAKKIFSSNSTGFNFKQNGMCERHHKQMVSIVYVFLSTYPCCILYTNVIFMNSFFV